MYFLDCPLQPSQEDMRCLMTSLRSKAKERGHFIHGLHRDGSFAESSKRGSVALKGGPSSADLPYEPMT